MNVSEIANVRVLPLGTDNFGRDVATELVRATGVSLLIGLIAGLIATTIGLTLGLMAGYVGGLADDIIMFFTNLFIVIPTFVLLILISFSIGQDKRGPITIAVVIGFTTWVWTAKAVRAQVFSLRNRDHVNLSKLSGHSLTRIIATDILPYIMSYVVMALILQMSSAILFEAKSGDHRVGTQNDGHADPGPDDELGDDLPGASPRQVVGVLPRAPDHRADYVLDEPDEYRPRPGIQPCVEGVGD